MNVKYKQMPFIDIQTILFQSIKTSKELRTFVKPLKIYCPISNQFCFKKKLRLQCSSHRPKFSCSIYEYSYPYSPTLLLHRQVLRVKDVQIILQLYDIWLQQQHQIPISHGIASQILQNMLSVLLAQFNEVTSERGFLIETGIGAHSHKETHNYLKLCSSLLSIRLYRQVRDIFISVLILQSHWVWRENAANFQLVIITSI